MPDDLDLTAELDAAEDVIMGRAETVVTEWGVRRWAERREHWYGTGEEAERVARAVARDHKKSGTPGEIIRRTVTYGPSEVVPEVCPKCGTAGCLEDKALDW